jgi:hypothetical protein
MSVAMSPIGRRSLAAFLITCVWMTASAQDAGQAPSGARQSTAGSGADMSHPLIKYHPGHYIELDPGASGGGLSGWLAAIASLKGAPGVKGVMLVQTWSRLEFQEGVYTQGAGSQAQGFALIDQLLAACRDAGLQFMLGVQDRSNGNAQIYSTPSSFGTLPHYFDELRGATGPPGYLDAPSGTTWKGDLQMIAKLWDPAVMRRYIALTQAYGRRYDSHPNFEMWATSATTLGVPVDEEGFSTDAYVAQLQVWMPAARAAFPTTGVRISTDFLDSPGQFTTLFNAAIPYAIAMGGPDVWVKFSTFPGTANLVFSGYEAGTDYRGVLPWVSELRTRDETGIWTPVQLFDYAISGGIATGGQMQSNYFIWSFDAAGQGPKAFTNAQILGFIASINGAVNFTKPSTYR